MRLIDADALMGYCSNQKSKTISNNDIARFPSAECPQNDTNIGTTEPNGDLVSRAEAIEAVKRTKPIVRSTVRNWGKMIADEHSKELTKALKALPSADRPQGEDWDKYSEKLWKLAYERGKNDRPKAECVDCDSCIYKTMWQEQEKAETLDRHTLDILQERFEAEELKAHAKSSGLKEHAVWNKAIRILEDYMGD